MHVSKLYPTTPLPGKLGWGFELYKFQMSHMWDITISQISTLSPSLRWVGIWLVVIEHAQPHDFKRSNSQPMGHAFASKLGQIPHLIPNIAWEGVVGLNIDRCINTECGESIKGCTLGYLKWKAAFKSVLPTSVYYEMWRYPITLTTVLSTWF